MAVVGAILAIVLQFCDTLAAVLKSFIIVDQTLRDQFEIIDRDDGSQGGPKAVIHESKGLPKRNITGLGVSRHGQTAGLLRSLQRQNAKQKDRKWLRRPSKASDRHLSH